MANEGKKILMFDEQTGLLTKEVMLGYVHGELSPTVRLEVEKFLATDEMHRDIIEGLKQIPDKPQVDSAIHAINERVAARTGAEADTGGISLEVPVFLSEYKKVAAFLTGVLLLTGIIFTVIGIRQSSPDIASNEKDAEQTTVAEGEPEPAQTKEQPPPLASDTASIAAATTTDSSITQEVITADATGGAIAAVENKRSENNNNKNTKETAAAKKTQADAGATTTSTASQPQTDSINLAMSYTAPAAGAEEMEAEKEGDEMNAITTQETRIAAMDKAESATDEVAPEFPGGEEALKKYLKNNIQYPESAKESAIEGRVYLTFTIGTSGRVKDIRVVKGVTKEINAEAIRLIANMPAWTPGKEKGKPVAMKRQLTVEFSLD